MTTRNESKKTAKHPALTADVSAEVAIVGGGITGILCAYALSSAGKSVVLVEEKELLSGATSLTTAFMTKVIDTDLSELVSIWGEDAAKEVFRSGQEAIEEFEKIIVREGIEAEFTRCDNYIFASTESQAEDIKRESEAYKKLQISAYMGKAEDLPFANYGHLRIPKQAKFSAAKFARALAEASVGRGAIIFENTFVQKIQEGETIVLETPRGKITAKDVIIATYQPVINKNTHLKKGMYSSYVFEVEVPKNSFTEAIYEDSSNPYYYFRIDRGHKHDIMIIGGEDHRAELGRTLSKKSFIGLENYLAKIMAARPYRIVGKWSGPILEPSDGLPLIGEIDPHLYVATAFSGNGMTYSMIASLLLRDLILGDQNPWKEIYDPKRPLLPKRLAVKGKDYAEEFFRGAVKNLLKN